MISSGKIKTTSFLFASLATENGRTFECIVCQKLYFLQMLFVVGLGAGRYFWVNLLLFDKLPFRWSPLCVRLIRYRTMFAQRIRTQLDIYRSYSGKRWKKNTIFNISSWPFIAEKYFDVICWKCVFDHLYRASAERFFSNTTTPQKSNLLRHISMEINSRWQKMTPSRGKRPYISPHYPKPHF